MFGWILYFFPMVVFFLQRFGFKDNDRYSWVYAFVYPMALFGSYFMTNLPVGIALNMTEDNLVLTTAGALVTIWLCVLKLEMCGRAVVSYTLSGGFSLLPPKGSATTPTKAESPGTQNA